MSEEQLIAFLAEASRRDLAKDLLRDPADWPKVCEMAAAAGFDLNEEDLLKFQAGLGVELSDEELEDIPGSGACHRTCYAGTRREPIQTCRKPSGCQIPAD